MPRAAWRTVGLARETKKFADRLLVLDPPVYDAHLAYGTIEYVVGSLPFFVRWFVGRTGAGARSHPCGEANMIRPRSFALLAALVVFLGHPARGQELRRLSLDDPAAIGLRLRADTAVKVEGAASLRIDTPWPTAVCLGEVSGLDVEAAQLLFRARVRTELEGEAYLEMWVHVAGGQYFSRGMNDAAKGKADWKAIQTPFTLQKGQKPDKVTLNLIVNGKGTVWVDDVVLSKAPLK